MRGAKPGPTETARCTAPQQSETNVEQATPLVHETEVLVAFSPPIVKEIVVETSRHSKSTASSSECCIFSTFLQCVQLHHFEIHVTVGRFSNFSVMCPTSSFWNPCHCGVFLQRFCNVSNFIILKSMSLWGVFFNFSVVCPTSSFWNPCHCGVHQAVVLPRGF